MRKDLGAKPYMYPLPVLIVAAYDENGIPNAMNAAWGTVCDSDKVFLCLSAGHKTVKNILSKGAFTVSMATAEHTVAADYLGVVSGNKVPDKFEKSGLHASRSENVDAPLIEEFPLAFECKLLSFDEENDYMIGEIVNVSVDENILTAEGKVNTDIFKPLIYDSVNHDYRVMGEAVGKAFSDGRKIK